MEIENDVETKFIYYILCEIELEIFPSFLKKVENSMKEKIQ